MGRMVLITEEESKKYKRYYSDDYSEYSKENTNIVKYYTMIDDGEGWSKVKYYTDK